MFDEIALCTDRSRPVPAVLIINSTYPYTHEPISFFLFAPMYQNVFSCVKGKTSRVSGVKSGMPTDLTRRGGKEM